jgi:hypothetical protein
LITLTALSFAISPSACISHLPEPRRRFPPILSTNAALAESKASINSFCSLETFSRMAKLSLHGASSTVPILPISVKRNESALAVPESASITVFGLINVNACFNRSSSQIAPRRLAATRAGWIDRIDGRGVLVGVLSMFGWLPKITLTLTVEIDVLD